MDTLSDSKFQFTKDGDLKHISKEKQHFEQMKKLKKVDDAMISITLKALENGIPLEGDQVYLDMLQQYPHYQAKLENRQKTMEKLK